MIDLVQQEFNEDEAIARIKPKTCKFIEDFGKVNSAHCEKIAENLAERIVSYAKEVINTHGQENRFAKVFACQIISGLDMLESCGLLEADEWFTPFLNMFQEVVFDELRRCGVRKYTGYLEHV